MINRLKNTFGLLALTGAALGTVACGDGPTCPTEIVVVIQSPSANAGLSTANDLDADKAGIQQDVSVRTNLKSGDKLTLTVSDDRTGGVAQVETTADNDGMATFTGITMPSGAVTLLVEGKSDCGKGSDEITVNVVTDALCDLRIDDGPIDNSFYAPVPVLNSSNDNDTDAADFQAKLSVASTAGFQVELFVLDVDSNNEVSLGKLSTDAQGNAAYEATLAQGPQVLRAVCTSGATNAASATNTVHVDTVIPTCTLTTPAEGVTVTPDHDQAPEQVGIQITWTGEVDHAGEDDVLGESASFFLDTVEFAGSDIDAGNDSSSVDFGDFGSPGDFALRFESQDHAGNACVGGFTANVIMDGCAIAITEPTDNVIIDSDGNMGNGLQTNVTVVVGGDCSGQEVFLDCGQGEISMTAPDNGSVSFANVTLSNSNIDEGETTCVARVINPENFQTTAERTIAFDTQAPGGSLIFTNPNSLQCGDNLIRNIANDADGNLGNGFQIEASVISPLAASRSISIRNTTCVAPCLTDAPAFGEGVIITLEDGNNDIRAISRDALGNESISPECMIGLSDIAIQIIGPVATGLLGRNTAGLVINGGNAEITVCATSSEANVTATLELDAGPGMAMSFNGGMGAFCTNTPVVMNDGNHTIVVTVMSNVSTRQGSDTQDLTVDLTPPDVPTGLVVSTPNRQQIMASWTAAAGATGYVLKYSTVPFTDFANQGTVVANVGTATAFTIEMLDTGTEYYIGVAAIDEVGNLSTAITDGPIIPLLDASGVILPPDLATPNLLNGDPWLSRHFGQSIVSANFNNDAFDDIAVSAPFKVLSSTSAGQVHIYFGTAAGIGNTPDLIISAGGSDFLFGFSMTRLNWSGGPMDGLAISSPFGHRVYIFNGATLSSGNTTLTTTNADSEIEVSPATNWFSNSYLGWSLSAGQLDAANTMEDLIIGAPLGGNSSGGVAILYGAVPNGATITLSDTATPTMMAGLVGHIFENPIVDANGSELGSEVAYLGDTRNGNGIGDLALAYSADNQSPRIPEDNRIYILRGRTPGVTSGMSFFTLGASDLQIINPTAATINSFGRQIGSIEDQNGDGFRDIVVTGMREGTGRAWIVSGSRTGTVTLNGTADYLTQITGNIPGTPLFGSGVANNATEENPDINGDGLEDLLLSGGQDGGGNSPSAFVWYGGSIPTGNIMASSADYIVTAPDQFKNNSTLNQPSALQISWAGDVDNNGLTDICWADSSAGDGVEGEGRMEILWDQ